ncbi:Predicted metal-binding protein [Anaerosphaera aminiphila DSM 21120]|uniref:Predicted metal-binding protein n=1 Tax=Anaerosphaera aminiphila DSM 21120 TaxID=1120995 RepID=A0A1M5PFG3_9FIRM|nr:CGGC domain-containing protein [Anaerosphaera aminiphila]SHH00492.1 Predicted metal-binding protein [Anaerosphaera aminiphila DSM 21120]
MKIGIIRCMQTEDFCPGTTDFKVIRERKGAFEKVSEDIEIIGFINCGGCPGKKAVLRARKLVKRGADTIVFASCIQKGNPIGYPCPFAKKMKEVIKDDLDESIKFIDYTH